MSERFHFSVRGDVYVALTSWSSEPTPTDYEPIEGPQAVEILRVLPRLALQLHSLGAGASQAGLNAAGIGGSPRILLFRRIRLKARPTPTIEDELEQDSDRETASEDKTHWIEIQMIGEDDEGLSGVRCKITLPTGRSIIQTTNRLGVLRVEGIASAGECVVEFPDLDSEAWETV